MRSRLIKFVVLTVFLTLPLYGFAEVREKVIPFEKLDEFFLFEDSDGQNLIGTFDISELAREMGSICNSIELIKTSIRQDYLSWVSGYYLSGDWKIEARLVFVNDRNEYGRYTDVLNYGFLVVRRDVDKMKHNQKKVRGLAKDHLNECQDL